MKRPCGRNGLSEEQLERAEIADRLLAQAQREVEEHAELIGPLLDHRRMLQARLGAARARVRYWRRKAASASVARSRL